MFVSVREAVEVLTDPLADKDQLEVRLQDDPEDSDMAALRRIGTDYWERVQRHQRILHDLQRSAIGGS